MITAVGLLGLRGHLAFQRTRMKALETFCKVLAVLGEAMFKYINNLADILSFSGIL
jgi:hypothetical protein